jgi:hypothetical protein
MADVILVCRSQTWIAWSANQDHGQRTQLSGENHVVERRLRVAVGFHSGIQTQLHLLLFVVFGIDLVCVKINTQVSTRGRRGYH